MNVYYQRLKKLTLKLIVLHSGMIPNAITRNVDSLHGGNGIVYSSHLVYHQYVHSGIGGHGPVYFNNRG